MAKNPRKKIVLNTPSNKETEETTKSLSKLATTKIGDSLKEFSVLSEQERMDQFGSQDFFEQFWEFFKDQHPNLLDEIDSQEKLTLYVQNLEKKGFSLQNIIENGKELHKEFKETVDEKTTIEESLKELGTYCSKPENKMPTNIFHDFASDIGLETSPHIKIVAATKLYKLGQLFSVWNKFLQDKGITLKDQQKSEVENILCPSYLPTERLLVSASIKKIRKVLPPALLPAFDVDFHLPVDIHSPLENLKDFQRQWMLFLDAHQANIDEALAKKLDKIIISNGDLYLELKHEGENIDWTKGFSEQTKNFRRMFNGLVTRQLFEEAKEKGTYIEKHLELLGKEFREFPPYFNELFSIYPYKHQEVIAKQPSFQAEYLAQEKNIADKELLLNSPLPEGVTNKTVEQRRDECQQAVFAEKEKLQTIKRRAYAAYITTQEPKIGTIVDTLAKNKFDMNTLSKVDQQAIINILVEKKLGDSIKNQIPNILGLDAHEYETFIKDLFDLNKKDIVIPTQYGNVPLHFLEKSFFGGPTQESMEINTLGNLITEQKNLPLNFKVQITEQNKDFFEDNIIFENLFGTFNSQVKLNDSYKVSVKNSKGDAVEGYLSKIPPSEDLKQEIENNTIDGGRFLYSHPITKPEDARTVMTWDGKLDGDPVVIPTKSEGDYQVDVLSKELNLNGEAIGALLFSHALGSYNVKNSLNRVQEKKLAQKFGAIDKENIYHDIRTMVDTKEDAIKTTQEASQEEVQEKNSKEFLEVWKSLKGYQDKEIKDEKLQDELTHLIGSKLLITGPESGFPPFGQHQYMNAEITEIDAKKGIFKMKFSGNEHTLGKWEGAERDFSLSKKGLNTFVEAFEYDKILKLPRKNTLKKLEETIPALQNIGIDQINNSFNGVHRDGSHFTIDIGKEKGQKVTHFGLIESTPGEDPFQESKIGYMYKIHHNASSKKFTITTNDKDKTEITLDYPNFLLFVADRGLQPKTEASSKGIEIPDSTGPDATKGKSRKGYSIASIIGLVKNFSKKINDGLKKYEDEQVEELTENVFYYGKLFNKLAGIMPSQKLKEAFGNAGDEYMAERDNKVWKKIEKYLKRYEGDPDFGSEYMREKNIKPLLNNEKPFKDNHQAAAILLATIKKGKGPYSRNTDWAGKGKRIRILFGEGHQKRYLMMKEKLERELQQGYNVNGQTWADDLQNEILKLEMKYITHCIDGRQLADRADLPKLEAMYSKKYAGELETEANKFFSETASSSTKEKGYSFDLARFEFFRLAGDRPQQALPCLKQMAVKATTDGQWKVFESAVLTGMLSGVFFNVSQEDKGYIKNICRTLGFLPGLRIKDPNHHHKVELFIKIATGEVPAYKGKTYNSANFSFGKGQDLFQFKDALNYDEGLNARLKSGGRLDKIAKFAAMGGTNFQNKTVIDLVNDSQTPVEWIPILREIEENSLEKDEDVDNDVKNNMHGLKQNILAKSQSLIDEITDFNGGKFKGKDKDAIQGMQTAWKEIAKAIPRTKLSDKNEVIYILKKFMNRFEGRGFNVEEKKFLVRGLLTAKKELQAGNTQSANNILWYMIVGNVIKNSGNGQVPDELASGLEAFKEFFKANLETILEKDVIEQGWDKNSAMGKIFVQQLDNGPYKVMNWDTCVDLEENKAFFGNNKDEREKRNNDRRDYNKDQIYINKRLYALARGIENKNFISNKFKDSFGNMGKPSTNGELHTVLSTSPKDIRIKNPEIIEKTRRRLSGQLIEGMSDEERALAMEDEGGYDDYY